ncbi:hypothetical protein KEG38_43210 [Polyangium jinanense]|uniref:hypothetical protein n=1 Tax=Polyangium jinanense TaxID=2829994 RepID=UPI002341EBB3|nr:hypothetical protein [Polyangium jinanense]MDC3960741.1 hypothetical protein [Polyangium jinanense]
MNDPPAQQPPTREELLERLEDLKRRTEELRDRADAVTRPSPAVVALRVFLLFGLPILVAIGVYVLTSSILFAILALVAALITAIAIALRLSPAPAAMTPGTRAFEAHHTAMLLGNVIAARREEQRTTSDPERRARLEREIAFLSEQLDENRAIVAANDGSPGKGHIGFKPYAGP